MLGKVTWRKEERLEFLDKIEEKTKEVEQEIEEWKTPKSQQSTDRESKHTKIAGLKEENRSLKKELQKLKEKKNREDERYQRIISQKSKRIHDLENILRKYSNKDILKLHKRKELLLKEIKFLEVKKQVPKYYENEIHLESLNSLRGDISSIRDDLKTAKSLWENQMRTIKIYINNLKLE